jgi:hypothetical protein
MKIKSFDEIYKIDEDKSKNGVPVEFGFNDKEEMITLVIAEMGNEKNQKIMRKYDKALESSRHNKKRRNLIWAKIVAQSILIDWSGVLDDDGNEVEATEENKIIALVKYDRLFSDILEKAQETERFRPDDDDEDSENAVEPEEETAENLPITSDGN